MQLAVENENSEQATNGTGMRTPMVAEVLGSWVPEFIEQIIVTGEGCWLWEGTASVSQATRLLFILLKGYAPARRLVKACDSARCILHRRPFRMTRRAGRKKLNPEAARLIREAHAKGASAAEESHAR